MFGLRCAQSAPAAAVGCAAAWCPRRAAGSGAGESATHLTQAEGEIDVWRAPYIEFEKGCSLQGPFQI